MGFRLVSPQDIKPTSNIDPAWYSAIQRLYHQHFYTTWYGGSQLQERLSFTSIMPIISIIPMPKCPLLHSQ